MPSEADTCRKFVVPKLQAAGWDNEPYSIAEQRTITDGRIVPVGKGFVRRPSKRVDYLLRYRRDFPLAVVEAKPEYKTAADGLQQAKHYAAHRARHTRTRRLRVRLQRWDAAGWRPSKKRKNLTLLCLCKRSPRDREWRARAGHIRDN